MFKAISTWSLCAFFLLLCVWGAVFLKVRPSDIASYHRLKAQEKAASSKSLVSTTQQNRKGVVKEIYFTQEDNSRLHYRIQSESSVLTLQPNGEKHELLEKLEKIKCWMQDKLYFGTAADSPMQQLRFFEAKEGTYRYSLQQFLAQSVHLSLFRLAGHELPASVGKQVPFLHGIAQDVTFAVSGKTPQFQAQHFKALLSHSPEEEK